MCAVVTGQRREGRQPQIVVLNDQPPQTSSQILELRALEEKKGEKHMLKEFREFIQRGSVIDLAVGVIIGGAFGAIVTSLVNDILMPLVGIVLGGVDFTKLSIQVGEATILYGNFIQAIVNFVIIAFVIFLIVRSYNKLQKEEEEAPPAPPEPSPEEKLLAEIRDLLKAQRQ
jgi:large conductance mechanosensitive channel